MGYLTVEKNFDPMDNDYNVVDSSETQVENKMNSKKNKVSYCYYSNVVGSPIINAVTGEKYPWKVGSIHENRFFKVIDAGISDNFVGKANEDSSKGRISQKAFYENPEQFMNHRNYQDLDEEIINNWYNRVNSLSNPKNQ
jgi:hypothetical protein